MPNTESILITGANGFSGIHACHYFSQLGLQVTAVVRNSFFKMTGCSIAICDLTDSEETAQLINKVRPKYVLHLAGKNSVYESWNSPTEYMKTNVMGTVHLLEGIRNFSPEARILVVGSMLQNPNNEPPSHPYAISKSMQIMVAQTWEHLFKLQLLIAKPCNLIGPGPSKGVCSILAKKIADMELRESSDELLIENPNAKRDFLDIRDAVEAYWMLLKNGQIGETYEIGINQFRTLEEIAEAYLELAKIKFEIKEKASPGKLPSNAPFSYSNLDKIKSMGWQPRYTLNQSLNEILDHFRLGVKRNE